MNQAQILIREFADLLDLIDRRPWLAIIFSIPLALIVLVSVAYFVLLSIVRNKVTQSKR